MEGIQAQARPTPILSLQMRPPSPFPTLKNYITGHLAALPHPLPPAASNPEIHNPPDTVPPSVRVAGWGCVWGGTLLYHQVGFLLDGSGAHLPGLCLSCSYIHLSFVMGA